MARRYPRDELIARLHAQIDASCALLIFGAGSGLSAKSAESGGADIIAMYSTAGIRMKGLPSIMSSLPYHDCNTLLLEIAHEALPLVKETPCVAGVGAHDQIRVMDSFLNELSELGFSGIANEPFAGSYGAYFAELMEEAGVGFSREVDMIRLAHQRGLFTLAWCTSPKEAKRMSEAGADMIGAMVLYGPLSTDTRSEEKKLSDSLDTVRAIRDAALCVRKDVLVITHGSPFMDKVSAEISIKETNAVGYACGSSGERIAAQKGIKEITEQYKSIRI